MDIAVETFHNVQLDVKKFLNFCYKLTICYKKTNNRLINPANNVEVEYNNHTLELINKFVANLISLRVNDIAKNLRKFLVYNNLVFFQDSHDNLFNR